MEHETAVDGLAPITGLRTHRMGVQSSWTEIESLKTGFAEAFARAVQSLPKGVAVFGAGCQGKMALEYLRGLGASVGCFIDNDIAKQGTYVDGVRVVAPKDAIAMRPEMVFIAVRQAALAIGRQLTTLGLPSTSFDQFFVMRHLGRIRAVRDGLLEDNRSRLVYEAIVKAMLTGRTSYCASVMEANQYFALPHFAGACNDHFVDAGAFVGDTVERFLWANNGAFARIYAFEPGGEQFTALRRRMERLRAEWALSEECVVCVRGGLGETESDLPFTPQTRGMLQGATFMAPSMEGEQVRIHTLDQYLDGRPATFVKADVEGMEMALLRGAAKTIRHFRPKLALSIYHSPDHIFTVAEYVNSLVPEYKIAVRQHAPVLMETVLYAWVQENEV